MESEMLQSPLLGLGEEDEADLTDWNLPLAFMKKRHCEKIEGSKSLAQSWRMKDRMKTVSVALVLCLNVGVDPPDVVKTTPCARLECWIDPLSMGPQKALETIGANLQKQYENWQPRARYKQSLDPTVDEVKKLCTSLRRNAKEERVLFHYNGHGVPRPTVNGEVWVFNKGSRLPISTHVQLWSHCDEPQFHCRSVPCYLVAPFVARVLFDFRVSGRPSCPIIQRQCTESARGVASALCPHGGVFVAPCVARLGGCLRTSFPRTRRGLVFAQSELQVVLLLPFVSVLFFELGRMPLPRLAFSLGDVATPGL